jgi:hypothetical protein
MRGIKRGDGEGFVVCECPGCGAPHHEPEERQVPALWWLGRANDSIQVCGTCANRLTSHGARAKRPLERIE